jgi:hypothetical protein
MMIPDKGRPNPKADSFSLYCNWVANRILMNLLPKTLLDNKLHRTMRNNRKKAIENKESPKKDPLTPVKPNPAYKNVESKVYKPAI